MGAKVKRQWIVLNLAVKTKKDISEEISQILLMINRRVSLVILLNGQ